MKTLDSDHIPTTVVRLTRAMAAIIGLILLIIPFHAFITVWASSVVGHYTLLRLWKEGLLGLLVIMALAVVVIDRRRPNGWRQANRDVRLWLVIKIYALVCVVAGLVGLLQATLTAKAYAYGVLLDLRFLAFFGVVWLTCHYNSWLFRHWRRLLLIPASLVVVFGILQVTVLPADFLGHFGYGPQTIAAIQTVDQKLDYQRIQSTLRGANPLGAYLVVVLTTLAGLLWRASGRRRAVYGTGFGLAGLALGLTFSRSAWIGAVAAIGWLVFWRLHRAPVRKYVLAAGVGIVLLAGLIGYSQRNNDSFQNAIFHTDENSQSAESSNSGHLSAVKNGLTDIIKHPQGSGTGSAGPASVYNHGRVRISENYYVQIGQESGLLGLGLFVATLILVGRQLWKRRSEVLARVLLASLIGISLIGMLSHVWTDDTLAYIWWGLAGIALAVPVRTRLLVGTADRKVV